MFQGKCQPDYLSDRFFPVEVGAKLLSSQFRKAFLASQRFSRDYLKHWFTCVPETGPVWIEMDISGGKTQICMYHDQILNPIQSYLLYILNYVMFSQLPLAAGGFTKSLSYTQSIQRKMSKHSHGIIPMPEMDFCCCLK